MSIFDKLFGSAPAPATPAPAAAPANSAAGQPGNIPAPTVGTAATAGTAPNGTVPDNVQAPVNKPEASPFDSFGELWQPNANASEGPEALINIDPKSIAEAASKTNFTKMINPDQLTAISQGGDAAVQALGQVLNQVAQGVYAQSAFASSKIVEQAMSKAREQFAAEIPSHVKKLQVSDSLRSENPALNHPAASPILGAIESQLTTKYPNASATEITKMAKQYLENFAGAINQPQQLAEAKAAAAEKKSSTTDWSKFLN